MEQNNSSFKYIYSAPQQEEIKTIREKYLPKEEDKMEQLRRLDQSAATKGTTAALISGVVGTLILGFGMSCAMVWELFAIGIIIGVIGIALVAMAYPLYTRITKAEREKITPEIMRLTDELMK